MKLTKSLIQAAKERFLSIEDLVYLYQVLTGIDYGLDVDEYRLRALGLMNTKGALTQYGLQLFEGMYDYEATQESNADFDLFWASVPSSDAFLNYPPTRFFKKDKQKARIAFTRACQDMAASEIIDAIRRDVQIRKDTSSKSNNLTYMKNPVRWLEDQEYLSVAEPTPEDDYEISIQ